LKRYLFAIAISEMFPEADYKTRQTNRTIQPINLS